MTANLPLIYAAWESMHYALREAMRAMDDTTLQYLAEHAENNDLVIEAAQDALEARRNAEEIES